MNKESVYRTNEDLAREIGELKYQLEEANETIEAIRTGQIDALVVQSEKGPQLFTLKSADQTYRVFIEKMTEGAVTLNPKGLILYCNSRFARMVDVPLSEIIGVSFEDFVAEENIEEYRQLFEKCWRDDCKGEVQLLAGSNRTPVQLSLTTLELEEGVSLSIILTDLTAQKETQKQLSQNNKKLAEINKALEASNHDLQQFASVASHDLQEPIRKIQIFSNLLKAKQAELTPESKKYLEKIIESSGRMKALVTDILNYSGLSANNSEIECIDLNELIRELRDHFELIMQEKGAEIIAGHMPCVDVIRGQIRQVFQNIISNALKFTRPEVKPVVRIEATPTSGKSFDSKEDPNGAYTLISIQDNGIGFDEKYVSSIFALFERLNSKDKFEGTGIGMAIAKKIIEKHDGLITATSKEGSGATFKIILPIVRKQALSL